VSFTLYPAIDLRGGRCVRLFQGDFGQQTVYGEDPPAMARRWEAAGARWLHLIDLDAAAGEGENRATIAAICRAVQIPVQVGGGVRRLSDIETLLTDGAARVILGTPAAEDTALIAEAVARFGERIVVALDGREGYVYTRGWRERTPHRLVDLGRRMAELGVTRFLSTDIARDGTLSEPNFASLAELIAETGRPVIASGGVSAVAHLERLIALGSEGAVVGKALYEGALRLEDALAAAGRC
jgi:phosphoribosylformimino-5-aminoimidazole carboxamide ribotide isomerase